MNSKRKLRVGIYLRLSNEDRDKEKNDDSESIKNQRNMLIDYISKNPDFLLIDEYCDEDLSGAGTFRPEFERLIKDCESKKIDVVLCKSQSRFSRDMEIVEKYINNKFKEWNIRFIGLSDNADTEVLGNKKARQINGLVNEWYLEDVSNDIKSAFYSKMKHGEFISPFAPYGYDIDPNNKNKLIIDSVASEIVQKIFKLYLSGFGFTGIANILNIKKIPCPSLYKYKKGIKLNVISKKSREEIKWTPNSIKRILKNEVYIGNLIQGKRTTLSYKNHKIIKKDKNEWVKSLNTHEAIIDEETFKNVQNAMKERTKAMISTGTVHLFSGKVFCLECKHCMRKKSTKKHDYLVCSNCYDLYKKCENKSSIRYDKLEEIILNKINDKIKLFYNKEELKKIINKNIMNKNIDKIESLEKQIIDLQNQISKSKRYLINLYNDKVNGLITIEQFNYLISNYEEENDSYTNLIYNIKRKINYYKDKGQENNIRFRDFFELKKLNKIIIDEFISKIYVGKDNKKNNTRNIYVIFNYK